MPSRPYHVRLGNKRTTVTLDEALAALLALKLGESPASPTAHSTVRRWLQDQLDAADDPSAVRVSQ